MIELNSNRIEPACPDIDGPKLLQRADIIWSRLRLEANEVLLVKVSRHMASNIDSIKDLMDQIFKREGDRVVLYVDGDIEFTRLDTGQK